MLIKKSFSSYIKSIFILGELLFLIISFLFIFNYIENKEQNKFIENAKLNTDLVNLYTRAKIKSSDYIPILSQASAGRVSRRGVKKRIDSDNLSNPFKRRVYIYSQDEGFYPKLSDVHSKLSPYKEYRNSLFGWGNELCVVNSDVVGDYTIFLSYCITGDFILKKNIKATKLLGYIYLDGRNNYWLTSDSGIKLDVKNENYVKLDGYKIGNKPQLVLVKNSIGIDNFYYIISDEDYVKRAFSESLIIGFLFFVKFMMTLVFTIIITKTFSKSLNTLVSDSRELAHNDNANFYRFKNYMFVEFQSLMNAITVILEKKNRTYIALKETRDNMENTIINRTSELTKAKKKAEDANLAKMNFLAQIAHEIRTPMNCIIGFCELIISKENPEMSIDYSKKIINESDTLLKLINDILDVSKIENGKMVLNQDSVNVNGFIDRIVELGNPFEGRDSVKINKSVSPDVPEHIGIDEIRLYQVLSNIYFNALKYTKEGSVSIVVYTVSGLLEISVIDTGIGIPENRLDTVFDDYKRLDGSLNIGYKGTGLGLSITQKVVELMGGRISVKSKLGSGSCFTISLPYKSVEVKKIDNNSKENKLIEDVQGKGKVLLVEDYPANRVIAKCHLEYAGFEVFEAENGKDALDMCRESKYDLILMDIQMPVLDGFSATKYIKTSNTLNSETPVLAMTANGLKSIEEKCKEIGMDGIILKPIRRKSFIDYIKPFVKDSIVV